MRYARAGKRPIDADTQDLQASAQLLWAILEAWRVEPSSSQHKGALSGMAGTHGPATARKRQYSTVPDIKGLSFTIVPPSS